MVRIRGVVTVMRIDMDSEAEKFALFKLNESGKGPKYIQLKKTRTQVLLSLLAGRNKRCFY